jgi:hypothetical protein
MSRTRIFLAILTMAQVKVIKVTFYLKARSATQTRTYVIAHQNPSYAQWMNYIQRPKQTISYYLGLLQAFS